MVYMLHCLRMYDAVYAIHIRRIGASSHVLRIFKCTHENVEPRRTRTVSLVYSRMYYLREMYLTYLDTRVISEPMPNSVVVV